MDSKPVPHALEQGRHGASPDREAAVAYGRLVENLHIDNHGPWRTRPAPRHHLADRGCRPLEDGFNPPVRPVAHPTGHADLGGQAPAGLAKPHPLHPAVHPYVAPDGLIGSHRADGSG